MPRLVSETIGAGDQSWLGSAHGIANCRTEFLDISAFTAGTHFPDGYIKSGTPVAKVGGVLVPYDDTQGTTTNAGVLAGFVFTDQKVVGATTPDFAVPVLDHGRIRTAKLPFTVTLPGAAAKVANVQFVGV